MNGITTLLVLTGVIVFVYFVVKYVSRIASWRLTLTVLTVAILAAIGAISIEPILNEIEYATTNLFGGGTP